MAKAARRRVPPFWLLIALFFLLYGSLSVGLTVVFGLPWFTPLPVIPALAVGVLLLAFGFGMYVWSLRSLTARRAFGKELFTTAAESALVTTGAYAHSRNPIYFSITLLLAGWFCVSRFAPLGILTALAFVHFMFVAKWEEKELTERFGKTYLDYKARVPFLIPRLRRKSGEGRESS
jgi:protein-S-isoprenylcysteine O-methyltransferase Ste14